MEVVGEGIVFLGEKGLDRQSAAFPGICVLDNGRWICGFRSAPSKNCTHQQQSLITWSDDEGDKIIVKMLSIPDGGKNYYRCDPMLCIGTA